MFRPLLIVLLLCGLAPGLWLRTQVAPRSHEQELTIKPLPLASGGHRIGPFQLEAAWQLTSRNTDFGGYSSLIRKDRGRMLAFSDRGYFLDIAEPGTATGPVRIGASIGDKRLLKDNRDVEAATFDPVTRRIWLALEARNAIAVRDEQLTRQTLVAPAAMKGWPKNAGPEAMVRLRDGRFIVLAEAFSGWLGGELHPALLFAGDPTEGVRPERFTFAGPDGFRPTDMAQLPDGRVLVLMRRVVWPIPLETDGRIVLADPEELRAGRVWRGKVLARLERPLPVDNFEAIAIDDAKDGTITVWLLSDDNGAVSQRTLLWRMRLDPKLMPRSAPKSAPTPDKQKAHDPLVRPAKVQS